MVRYEWMKRLFAGIVVFGLVACAPLPNGSDVTAGLSEGEKAGRIEEVHGEPENDGGSETYSNAPDMPETPEDHGEDAAVEDAAVAAVSTDAAASGPEDFPVENPESRPDALLPDAESPPSERLALIKEVRFAAHSGGRSALLIETDRPVQHELARDESGRLNLRLPNTHLPPDHRSPLVVTDSGSALDHILPTNGEDQSSSFLITLRKEVPHTVTQWGNFLEVVFEPDLAQPASAAVSPAPSVFSQEQVHAAESGVEAAAWTETLPDISSPHDSFSLQQASLPRWSEAVYPQEVGAFTGTPISMDLHDTDIRNVFRILQHISGRNFAVDQDVSGRVTLNLENPVPWDEILSLVLRMNGLDMIYEGSIIRIATLATIRKEAQKRQEALQTYHENEKQSIALTPLSTEYILVNYSNVSSEILPHIRSILSERGSANADVRNNQLIIRDTPEVIANARQIVRRIDKMTPQVVIEARIVEANENLTRVLGVEWQASTRAGDASDYATLTSRRLGGQYGYNMSLNGPEGAGTIGLHFARIVGSPLALNAQIQLSETKGDSRIVSSPRIVTLDNKTASITQGFEYPYTTRNSDGDVTTSFKKIEMKLEVTPHITADNRVAMKVTIDKDDLYQQTSDGPAMQTKKVETELLVNDGDTIVIGGVLVTRMTDTRNAVPFFSKIPLLGWLFKSTNISNTKEELLIFLTPRIMQLEPARISS